jgi:ribosomal protein S3
VIGVKVWICNGEIFGKRDLSPNIGAKNVKQNQRGLTRMQTTVKEKKAIKLKF